MALELRQVTREESGAWQDAVSVGFMSTPDPVTHAFADAIFDHRRTLATFDRGKIVGTYVSFPTSLTMPGQTSIDANAISGITVMPTHRNRGVLRTAITTDLTAAKERGDAVAILLASEFPIYGRFGFGVATEASEIELDTRGLKFLHDAPPGSIEVLSSADALPFCKDVFSRARRDLVGAIDRHEVVWDRMFGFLPDREEWKFKGFIAVSSDASGKPDGFVRYSAGDQWVNSRPLVELTVTELTAATPQAHLRLWHYLATMAWVAKVITKESTVDDDLALLVADGRAVHRKSRVDHTWARALDVEKLLTTRAYEGSDKLVFTVTDDLGFAAGTYCLDATPDGSSCKRVRTKPDLTLTVHDLSSLAFGGFSVEAAARVGRVVSHRPGTARRFDRLFRTGRAPFNPTRF